ALLDEKNNTSAFVIDPKGQLCAITTRQRMAMGHDVYALNPYGVLGIPSARYNPLAHLDPQSVTFTPDCERIAQAIIDQGEQGSRQDNHFEVSALDYTTLNIMYVKLFEPDKSLVRVWQLLSLPDDLRVEHCTLMETCGHPVIEESAARYTIGTSREV